MEEEVRGTGSLVRNSSLSQLFTRRNLENEESIISIESKRKNLYSENGERIRTRNRYKILLNLKKKKSLMLLFKYSLNRANQFLKFINLLFVAKKKKKKYIPEVKLEF